MNPFTRLTAVAAPLDLANVDTDKIIPARYLRKPREGGYGQYLFHDLRFDAEERARPDFLLNRPPWCDAQILVAGVNFGCGSSREAAVYALMDFGFRCVIASSFGDIHYGNELQNGMLPVILPEDACAALRRELHANPGVPLTVDLEAQRVTGADGTTYRFEIDTLHRERLLKGLDDVGLILQHLPEIESFEQRRLGAMPWLAQDKSMGGA